MREYLEKGWIKFAHDAALAAWGEAARQPAWDAVAAPENAHWHQCEGTWFVGVDALPNDVSGAVGQSGPLTGQAHDFARALFGPLPLHQAQLSVIYDGYPRPREGESDAAGRYRLKRDAAHLDGLKLEGAERQRRMGEYHAWVLGIPLSESAASPMVVWEGSHILLHEMLRAAFAGLPESQWHEVDLTARYQALRARIFEECQRVEVCAKPGEAYLMHRFALHGVAPWGAADAAPRMIAYFRPEAPSRTDWLNKP